MRPHTGGRASSIRRSARLPHRRPPSGGRVRLYASRGGRILLRLAAPTTRGCSPTWVSTRHCPTAPWWGTPGSMPPIISGCRAGRGWETFVMLFARGAARRQPAAALRPRGAELGYHRARRHVLPRQAALPARRHATSPTERRRGGGVLREQSSGSVRAHRGLAACMRPCAHRALGRRRRRSGGCPAPHPARSRAPRYHRGALPRDLHGNEQAHRVVQAILRHDAAGVRARCARAARLRAARDHRPVSGRNSRTRGLFPSGQLLRSVSCPVRPPAPRVACERSRPPSVRFLQSPLALYTISDSIFLANENRREPEKWPAIRSRS